MGYVRGLCWHLALAYLQRFKREANDADIAKTLVSGADALCGEVARLLLGKWSPTAIELSETQMRVTFNLGVEAGFEDGHALEPDMLGTRRIPPLGSDDAPPYKLLREFRAVDQFLRLGGYSTESEAEGKRLIPFIARPVYKDCDWRAAVHANRDRHLERQVKLADSGDTDAQYNLGSRLAYGIELPKNHVDAASYLSLAAKKGHPSAQFLLATLYEEGLGVERNYSQAKALYEQAASGRDQRSANIHLGRMFEQGRGTRIDYARAQSCYRAAGEDNRAWLYLGDMYRDGRGVSQDVAKAVQYYRSAARGEGQANVNLGKLYLEGRGVTKDLNEAYRLFSKVAESQLARDAVARQEAITLRDSTKEMMAKS